MLHYQNSLATFIIEFNPFAQNFQSFQINQCMTLKSFDLKALKVVSERVKFNNKGCQTILIM